MAIRKLKDGTTELLISSLAMKMTQRSPSKWGDRVLLAKYLAHKRVLFSCFIFLFSLSIILVDFVSLSYLAGSFRNSLQRVISIGVYNIHVACYLVILQALSFLSFLICLLSDLKSISSRPMRFPILFNISIQFSCQKFVKPSMPITINVMSID